MDIVRASCAGEPLERQPVVVTPCTSLNYVVVLTDTQVEEHEEHKAHVCIYTRYVGQGGMEMNGDRRQCHRRDAH